jgi:uncharacterized caspase-like protein
MTALLRATVVGLNEYGDKRNKQHWLEYARTDAEAIGTLLSSSNTFRVEGIDLLTNGRATEKAVRDSLHNTFASHRYASNTISLFYFAGHGTPHPLDDRVILCCHDVDAENPNRGGLRLNDIYDILLGSGADCNIAIIDACFSGDIINVQDLKRVYHVSPVEQAKKAITALQGREDKTIAIFAACRSSEKARETAEREHGIYTDELLHGWRDGLARDQNGVVSLLGLANYLSQRFSRDKQVPQFTIRGASQIALLQAPPREEGTLPEKIEPLKAPNALTNVYDEIKIPIFTQQAVTPAQKKKQVIVLSSLTAALVLCVIATVTIPFLSNLFFWGFFIWGIALATLTLAISLWTLPLVLAQAALLLGYGYDHFAWRIASFDPTLEWLAGGEPWCWTLVISETILLGISIFFELISG